MNIHKTKVRGQEKWTVDLRSLKYGWKGQIFRDTKEEVVEEMRKRLAGTSEVEFTHADRLAKKELTDACGQDASMLDAVRYYIARAKPKRADKKLADAIDECLADANLHNRRADYLRHFRVIVNQFSRLLGPTALCSEVEPKHIRTFLFGSDTTKRPKFAGETLIGMRRRLATLFQFCVRSGYCIDNPVRAVKLPKFDAEEPKVLTIEEVHRLLDTAQTLAPHTLSYFVLGLFCGIRPKELKRLRRVSDNDPQNVHIEDGEVIVPAHVSKLGGRGRRVVQISENAKAWLRVVQNLDPRGSQDAFRWVVHMARIEWSSDVMRHSFASYHLQFHGSAEKTAHEMGHRGDSTVLWDHYKAVVRKEAAAEFWKIEPAVKELPVEPSNMVALPPAVNQ